MTHFDLKAEREALWQALAAGSSPQFDREACAAALQRLFEVDRYWTFPGRGVLLRLSHYLESGQPALFSQLVRNSCHALQVGRYRQQAYLPFQTNLERLDRPLLHEDMQLEAPPATRPKPYFEVLIVHPLPADYEMLYRQQLAAFKSPYDEFVYDIVFVDNAEDALNAVLANTDVQACVYLNHIQPGGPGSAAPFAACSRALLGNTPPLVPGESVELNLCRSIRCIRPELDHYLVSELSPAELPFAVRQAFSRVLFHLHPFQDLHAAILNGVRNRYSTPFFDALQAYSRQPKGVFHALPLSRGASVKGSPWINDMLEFYGDNIFLAETSSTQGGLDSLLDPTGAIKQAHVKAAECFGADHSYFVTNGTSTSNKIVMQANLRPGDIVLLAADCHKSVPYAAMLTGAHPVFLEAYPLPDFDLYGGVDLAQIKSVLLDLRRCGLLDRVRQITLTNSTFDGLVYNAEDFMAEILALKPDLIFHWDEAWSAFAYFHPLYYSRTAMSAVAKLRRRLQSPEYRVFQAQWQAEFDADPDENKWQRPLYPHPDRVCLRVYATHSTHKTLTSFRQGSMIHVADAAFGQARFVEAYRIHTSTSPNYQIIASLDIGRRQAALEGFHRVREALRLALQLRARIAASDLLKPCFRVLDDSDLIPATYRAPGDAVDAAVGGQTSLAALAARWGRAGFVIDPTRITLDIAGTGLDGTGFRQLLMTRYDIQVNKTSRHTVLLLVNIGATQATIDYLLQVLHEVASLFQHERRQGSMPLPRPGAMPLPSPRRFHQAFLPFAGGSRPACDLRAAWSLADRDGAIEYVPLAAETVQQVREGRLLVSAAFVTPYPPGFPVLVPGQILTAEILAFFHHTRIREIHGFDPVRGFKVFCDAALERAGAERQGGCA